MGCAAGTFESRCRNPSCAYVPETDGYCCPNCKKMHDESLVWDVKNNINTKSSNEDIKGHCRSPALPYQLCRVHIQGSWQDLGTEERKSFLYLALVRNDKELHCRRISGKEPIPRERTNFNICFDRGMVLVQDAKVGDHFELKYQVGKRCRLVASGISVVMVKRDVEDLEHQMECQQVTAKVPTTGRCGNPICSYAAETNGFCCAECKQMKQQSSCGALRNLRVGKTRGSPQGPIDHRWTLSLNSEYTLCTHLRSKRTAVEISCEEISSKLLLRPASPFPKSSLKFRF